MVEVVGVAGNLYVVGAIAAALFLGGWKLPAFVEAWAAAQAFWLPQLFEFLLFQAKAWIWVILIIQLRWTLPRLRVDQLMRVVWATLTPLAFAALIGTAIWQTLFPDGVWLVSLAMVAGGALFVAYFWWRVFWQLRNTKSAIDVKWIV